MTEASLSVSSLRMAGGAFRWLLNSTQISATTQHIEKPTKAGVIHTGPL